MTNNIPEEMPHIMPLNHETCQTDLWAELDLDKKIKAVAAVRVFMNWELAAKVTKAFMEKPDTWALQYHFTWGMAVRNKIRTLTGIMDDELPSGNWDDYYVQAVETALYLKELI